MKKSLLALLAILCLCVGSINAATVRVYFEDARWSKVNAYFWEGGVSNAPDWPGIDISNNKGTADGKTYFYVDLENANASGVTKVIFNNGEGTQTSDLPATNNAIYSISKNPKNGSTDPVGSMTGKVFTPMGVAWTQWELVGEEIGWNDGITMDAPSEFIRTITTTTTGEIKFKEKNNWNKTFGNISTTISGNGTYVLVSNEGGNIKLNNENGYSLTFTLNILTGELVVKGFPGGTAEDPSESQKSIYTLFYTNPKNWNTPFIWAWIDSSHYTGENYPGYEMNKVTIGGRTLWMTQLNLTKEEASNISLEFVNAKKGENNTATKYDGSGNEYQIANIALENGMVFGNQTASLETLDMSTITFPWSDASWGFRAERLDNWGTQTPMEKVSTGVWKYVGRIDGPFKFCVGAWEYDFGMPIGSGAITKNGAYNLIFHQGGCNAVNGNIQIEDPTNTEITFTLYVDSQVLIIEGLPDSTLESEWYMSFNDAKDNAWELNRPMQNQIDLTTQEYTGVFKSVITFVGNGDTANNKIVVSNGKLVANSDGIGYSVPSGVKEYGPIGGNKIVDADTPAEAIANNNYSWTLTKGTWTISLDTNQNPPTIEFDLGDQAIVNRAPSDMWLVGSFNEWKIPTNNGGIIDNSTAKAIHLAPKVGEDGEVVENTFEGTFVWREEGNTEFGIVGTYGSTDASNWFGPNPQAKYTPSFDEITENGEVVERYANDLPLMAYNDKLDPENGNMYNWSFSANPASAVKFTVKLQNASPEGADPSYTIGTLDIYDDLVYNLPNSAYFIYCYGSQWDSALGVDIDAIPETNKVKLVKDEMNPRVWKGYFAPTKMDNLMGGFVVGYADGNYYQIGPKPASAVPMVMQSVSPGQSYTDAQTQPVRQVVGTAGEALGSSNCWTYDYQSQYDQPIYVALNVDHQVCAFSLETIATGVDEVEAIADDEAVYFNMQGVRVANPINGLYIRVQGGKASKVMF